MKQRPPRPADWVRLRPAFTPDNPAMMLDRKADPADRTVRLISGAAAIVFAVVVGWLNREIAPFVAIFGAIGVASIAITLLRPPRWYRLKIDDTAVTVEGPAGWREPVKNYTGVAMRETQPPGQAGTLFVIELEHDDPDLAVPLHVQAGGQPPNALLAGFAERFGLPALLPDGNRVVERAAPPPAVPPGTPPDGVTLAVDGPQVRIRLSQSGRQSAVAWVFFLGIPLLLSGGAYALTGQALFAVLVLALIGGGLGLLAAIGWWSTRAERSRVIALDGRHLWIESLGNVEARIPLDAIRSVRTDTFVAHPNARNRIPKARLLVEGESERIDYVGNQLDGDKLAWVRDYLRLLLASR